ETGIPQPLAPVQLTPAAGQLLLLGGRKLADALEPGEQRRPLFAQVHGGEKHAGDADGAAALCEPADALIVEVARVVERRTGTRVRQQDRRLRQLEELV